jgi:N utilization substance protein A
LQLFISRALSPAKVSSIKIIEEKKRAEVTLKIEEVSKAIGRGGQNIKLASLITGYELDVIREGVTQADDDVELKEFDDEIDGWIIDEFTKVGLDTAKSILNLSIDDLVRRTDLEEETIQEVVKILKSEFE